MKKYLCLGCGFSYDEALGLPEHGIAPGTRWADIADDWVCPGEDTVEIAVGADGTDMLLVETKL
jgi:rubredoxin